MIIHLLMKDIFSDVNSFLRPSALQLNQEQDLQLIFEVLAFDEYNTVIVLG